MVNEKSRPKYLIHGSPVVPVENGYDNPESMPTEERTRLLPYVALWTFLPLLSTLFYVFTMERPGKTGKLADSDCYARLLRVEQLYNTGKWYDPVDMRSNAPYGQTSHWTRPFDVLLLLGALPLTVAMDFKAALFWWGVVISPVLLLASALALKWATKPILDKRGSFSVAFLFLAQVTLWDCFLPGRPDHHSLLIFLYVISIGLAIRMTTRPLIRANCYITGAISALSMWIVLESLAPVGIILAALGLLWLLEHGDFMEKALHYTLAMTVMMALSLPLERSWHTLGVKEYDRLSIVHFSIFAFITAFCAVIAVLSRRTKIFNRWPTRLASILIGTALLALFVFIFFPKFYKGPYADIDPRLADIWLNNVAEMQPLISSTSSMTIAVQVIGGVIISIPFVVCMLFRQNRELRRGWVYILLGVVVFGAAAIFQYIRWSYYAQATVVIPMTALMVGVLYRRRNRSSGILKALRNILVKLLFTVGLLFAGAAAQVLITGEIEAPPKIPMIDLCEYLNEPAASAGRKLRILTHIDVGEEILYRTEHEVIGTPVTIRGSGLLDTFDMMGAKTDRQTLQQIRRRQITSIIILLALRESLVYDKSQPTATFSGRLRSGVIPDWLTKIQLPDNIADSFIMFEVKPL